MKLTSNRNPTFVMGIHEERLDFWENKL